MSDEIDIAALLGTGEIDMDDDDAADVAALILAGPPELPPNPLEAVEDQLTGDLEHDSEVELDALAKSFRANVQRELDRLRLATDSEYWVCLCFQDRETVEKFIKKAKIGKTGEKYLDGHKAARILGIDLS